MNIIRMFILIGLIFLFLLPIICVMMLFTELNIEGREFTVLLALGIVFIEVLAFTVYASKEIDDLIVKLNNKVNKVNKD